MLVNGIATVDIIITIHNYNETTKELTSSDEYLILEGSGLPANSTEIKPLPVKEKFSQIFDGEKWKYIQDNRGKTAYDTSTKEPIAIVKIGVVPDGFTLLKPNEFDKWNGTEWVLDSDKKNSFIIKQNQATKELLLSEVTVKIATLQDAIDLDISENGDTEKLKMWKKYRILLTRIDINQVDIEWPEMP